LKKNIVIGLVLITLIYLGYVYENNGIKNRTRVDYPYYELTRNEDSLRKIRNHNDNLMWTIIALW